MNVVAGFTLVKVGLRRLFSANGCLPFQLAATVRASTRIDVNRLHGLRRQRFGSRALSRPAHQRRVAKVNSVRVKCPAQRAYIRPCCAGPCLRCDGTPGMHFLSLKRVACPTRTTCGPLPLGNPTPTGSATCVKMTGTLCVSRRTVAAIDVGAARMTSSFCWRYGV
jgi:hypothetical protein